MPREIAERHTPPRLFEGKRGVHEFRGSLLRRAAGDQSFMPQVWMTYHEIAELLGCEANEARTQVIQRALDRKRSRDGFTRAKLDPVWMAQFYAQIRNADPALDQAIRGLQMVHTRMSWPSWAADLARRMKRAES